MKNTIIGLAGRRLIIKPSQLNIGMVSISIFDKKDALLECITLDCSGAAVAASAIENVAEYCEKNEKKQPVNIGTDWGKVSEIARGVA